MGGWDTVRARLKGDSDGRPLMYFMDNCPDAIRTLPMLQHDEINIEDVDTEGEDHAPDEIRYACMSRPISKSNRLSPVREMLAQKENSVVILRDDINSLRSNKIRPYIHTSI